MIYWRVIKRQNFTNKLSTVPYAASVIMFLQQVNSMLRFKSISFIKIGLKLS